MRFKESLKGRMTGRRQFTWRAGVHHIELGRRTLLMGIVNVTPDSFSGDGVLRAPRREGVAGLEQAMKLVEEGADILDAGGA